MPALCISLVEPVFMRAAFFSGCAALAPAHKEASCNDTDRAVHGSCACDARKFPAGGKDFGNRRKG